MKRSLSVKVLLLVPFLFFCCPKNAQHAVKTDKAGEIVADTMNKSAPKENNQRIIHNSADQKTVDSLKNSREKRK
ncbi:MAG: hypothetical protein NTY96_05275 [Bacteroidetes bacterium]|nr:hypothetical protein [Bacteroidota bacterium]